MEIDSYSEMETEKAEWKQCSVIKCVKCPFQTISQNNFSEHNRTHE
jgi:hypothetical protein